MKIILTLLIAQLGWVAYSQGQAFNWAKQIGNYNGTNVDIAMDNSGNTYVLGHFSYTSDLDPGSANYPLTSNGDFDIFIVKLTSAGDFVWAKQVGGTAQELASNIETDQNGNVYFTGTFKGTVDFDPGAGTVNLTAIGTSTDIFFSKLDTDGNFVWVKVLANSDNESVNIMEVHGSQLFLTGSFKNAMDFDPNAGSTQLSALQYSAFLAVYDLDGNLAWAKMVGGNSSNDFVGSSNVSVDPSGNIYTSASFLGTVDANPGAGVLNLTASSGYDGYLSKLDSNGNLIWAKHLTGNNNQMIVGLEADAGAVYFGGYIADTTDFDMGPGTALLSNGGGAYTGYVGKLDAFGNFQWVQSVGSNKGVAALETDSQGNVYSVANYSTNGYFDVTLQKYSGSGNSIWTKQFGSASDDRGLNILLTPTTDLYTVGNFSGSSSVDFNTESGQFYMSPSNGAGYILKLSPCTVTGTDVRVACSPYTWIDGNDYTASTTTATHTLVGASGCDSVVTLNLTIANLAAQIQQNSDGSLTASSGSTYQWINCATNTPISGQTGQTFTPSANGNYAVIVSLTNCSDTSACFVVNNLGLSDANQLIAMDVYPNPSTDGMFTVSTVDSYEQLHIAVYSLDGKKVMEQEVKNTQQFDLKIAESQGVYLLEIATSTGLKTTRRLVKN